MASDSDARECPHCGEEKPHERTYCPDCRDGVVDRLIAKTNNRWRH